LKKYIYIEKQVMYIFEAYSNTYVFEAVLAHLSKDLEEPENREPGRPENNLVHLLYVHHSEDKYELVEDEVPESVLYMLRINITMLTSILES